MISNSQPSLDSSNKAVEAALDHLAGAALPPELEGLRALVPPQGTVARVFFGHSQEHGGAPEAVIVYAAAGTETSPKTSTPAISERAVFRPLPIRGEPLSSTVIAERR